MKTFPYLRRPFEPFIWTISHNNNNDHIMVLSLKSQANNNSKEKSFFSLFLSFLKIKHYKIPSHQKYFFFFSHFLSLSLLCSLSSRDTREARKKKKKSLKHFIPSKYRPNLYVSHVYCTNLYPTYGYIHGALLYQPNRLRCCTKLSFLDHYSLLSFLRNVRI